jgi:transposase-like protein
MKMGKSKRRTYSAEFKLDTVMEGLRGEKSIAQICRERGIKDNQYYNWREIFIERSAEIFADQRKRRDQEKEERIAELERMIGKLTMENDMLKKAKNWLE